MKKTITLIILIALVSGFAAAESQDFTKYENLKDLLESDRTDYLFLDVRTAGEYEAAHIPGAVNIPYDRLPEALPAGTEKDTLIIVYCRSGNRSGKGAKYMRRAGYSNVQDFGGIGRWKGELE